MTSDGTVNAANAEANLTFDGSSFVIYNSSVAADTALISVKDALNNSLFVVNSDGWMKVVSKTSTGQTATFDAFTVADVKGNAIFFDYMVKETGASYYRAGTIMSVWNESANTVEYTETSTNDLGGATDGLDFTVKIVSNNLVLEAAIASGTWTVKVSVRIM